MRFSSLVLFWWFAAPHDSLALKGGSSALRLGTPRSLQNESVPPPKVAGTGTTGGEPIVPKETETSTVQGNGSFGAEQGSTVPQVGGTVPKDKTTTDKGTVPAPGGGSTFQADGGAPMPKEDKDKKAKENKDCKQPKNLVSSRRRTQLAPTDKVPPSGMAGTTTGTGVNAGPTPGGTVDKTTEQAPKVGTDGTGPAMEPAIQPDSTTPAEEQQFTPMEPEASSGGEQQRFCLQSVVTEELCAAVQVGELPADSKKASGTLSMELSHDSADPQAAVDVASQILNAETPSKFIGCSRSFRILQEGGETAESTTDVGEDVEPEAGEATYVTGLQFGEFKSTGDACETQVAENLSCAKVKADVEVYYQGKSASEDEIQEMFAMLTEIIQEQAASGSFAEAGVVDAIVVEGGDASGIFGLGGDDGSDGGPSVGLAAGVALGALVVVGLVGGIWYRSRKRRSVVARQHGKNNNPETDDSSNE